MKFTITAGHGSGDPGATRGGVNERDLMTALRDIVAMKLRAAGHVVRTDGGRFENWPLAAALGLIPGSDIAIELHTNAVDSPLAAGVEVVAAKHDRLQAQNLAKAIADVMHIPLRKDGGFYDVDQHRKDRGWNNPAAFVRRGGMIVETFFLSNPQELEKYQQRFWLVAGAIATALSGERPR
jgi:N-acetylmuramoyl-L-alanine amidase